MVKNPLANAGDAGDVGSIPGWGRSAGEGNGNPLQYSCLGNPMDRGAWRATARGAARVGHNLATTQQPKVTEHAQSKSSSYFKNKHLPEYLQILLKETKSGTLDSITQISTKQILG